MERLTYRDKEGRAQWMPELLEDDSGLAGALIRDRLAAYEDTGLEPESFKRTFTEDALLILTGQLLGVTPDRLRELAQAKKEGRLVVLPCEIGSPVYSHARKLDGADYVRETEFWWSDIPQMGKTVFLTREAAEAALKEREDAPCKS